MIEKLTPEQIAKFPEYVKRWTAIGLCCEPANRKMAKEGILEMYKIAGLKNPKVVFCSSPLAQGITRSVVEKKIKDIVGTSVRDSVGDSVRDIVRDIVGTSVGDSGYGQHDANWLAFYRYFSDECGLKKETEKLNGMWKVCSSAGWFLPHEKICWVCERTSEVHLKNNRIHNERGMAIKYPDGWGVYGLNGVRVPGIIVETKPESMSKPWLEENFLKQNNAEVRREIVRKCGIDLLCHRLGSEQLDKRGDYELLSINIGNNRRHPALKMRNPSVGCWHVEWVSEECKTVEEALNFRNGTKEQPLILT
jgi:hypothetical protein